MAGALLAALGAGFLALTTGESSSSEDSLRVGLDLLATTGALVFLVGWVFLTGCSTEDSYSESSTMAGFLGILLILIVEFYYASF